jgi:hydrogenase maturation protein HypF
MTKLYLIRVRGIVQGVGFRPFVYRLAAEAGLKGYVFNDSDGVEICLECERSEAEAFGERLKLLAPPLSHIVSIKVSETKGESFGSFEIRISGHTEGLTLVPPDVAICDDCRRELLDKTDRRYSYPFINCTNCGPRYSIIKSIPYDRAATTMAEFEMCPDCAAEYSDPADRRFHAQPDCCSLCGPEVYMDGLSGHAAIEKAAGLVNLGGIIAIKGLGGYHLICDAANDTAVEKLRKLKNRGEKPFAVMCADVENLEKHRALSETEKNIITSAQAPVLLLDWGNPPFSESVNPMGKNIGVMLAYTPLHILLMKKLKTDFIIATSGNLRDEPIASSEDEASSRLRHYTKHILHHNREIHNRVDDSVAAEVRGAPYLLRRARGFAPYPVMLPSETAKCVAGAGAHLKSSVCFASKNFAFVSQYIGDLDSPETRDFYSETWCRMSAMLGLRPELAVIDIHPDYYSTRFAAELGVETVELQHHLAHFYAVLGENFCTDDAIGLILDGTGLGTDGRIWGGELFVRKEKKVTRAAHLPYMVQPGMDTAAKKPVMMLVSLMNAYGLQKYNDYMYRRFSRYKDMLKLTEKMVASGLNSVKTSSTGRIFEAAGSLLSGLAENDYEAHLAVKAEYMADTAEHGAYEADLMNPAGLFHGLFRDMASGVLPSACSARFHNGFAQMLTESCEKYSSGIKTVALSGGVFQNMLLLKKVIFLLEQKGFRVLTHSKVPSNDGCISLGQVCAVLSGEKFLDKDAPL